MNNNMEYDTYFLKDNSEVKIISTVMPHTKVFIRNVNGRLIVSELSFSEEENIKKEANLT